VAAVLDWELCTLGDPLADVGYLLGYWTDPGEPPRRPNDPSGAGGFGSRADLTKRYASATGLDLTALDFYVALGAWRLAVIAEGVYARYLAGVMGDADEVDLTGMGDRTAALADEALALV
jgi:aminoglycoside phosphotransferase (APT) family kinase protein